MHRIAVRILIVLGIVLLASAAYTLAADAAGAGAGAGLGQRLHGPIIEHLRHLAQELNLTEQQKQEIKGILVEWRKEHAADFQAHRPAIAAALRDLAAARHAGDKAALQKARGELRQAIEALPGIHELRHKVLAVLTPEQREKLKELHEAHAHPAK